MRSSLAGARRRQHYHILLAVLCVLSCCALVAYTGDTRKQAVARELQESLAPPLLNATLPRRSLLFQLERQSTERWNHSRRVLLLGKKARRDFRVYDWAFRARRGWPAAACRTARPSS